MAEPSQLAYRTLKGIGLLDAAPVYQPVSGFERPTGNLRCCTYSPDGKFFAWASPEQVTVIDPSVGHIVTVLPAPNVYELGFSPLGTYIITWQRPSKDDEGNAVKNLKVWRTIDDNAGADGERNVIGKFVQKSQTGWNLQYTSDEKFCARTVTNEVQFYESSDLGTVWNKLHVDGITDFAVAPGKEHSVAVFVPERKGQPAAVKVFNVPSFSLPVSQKTFFKGDKVQLKWNNLGTSLIVLAQTEVDKSNKSYYGETNMYILSANGGFDSRIELDKEGPIHDVTWSPNSKEFGVVYGYMPAKTTIFDTKANPTHNFGLAPRNTILFSPHGRLVLVAGFGNLAGQLDIYDLQKDFAKVCTIEASNASVCEWSSDGKHILTATTSPRLRVDNGVSIWHVGGGLMYKEDMTELYQVNWRPQSIDNHPLEDPLHPMPTPHSSALAYLGTVKTPSKPAGAYRPPGARGTSTPLHFKREDQGGAAYVNDGVSSTSGGSGINGFGKPRRREVPGAETVEPLPPGAAPGGGVSLTLDGDEQLSKAALKNKKKREAKKAKDAAEKAAGLEPPSLQPDRPTASSRSPTRSPGRSPVRRSGHERTGSRDHRQQNLDGRQNRRPKTGFEETANGIAQPAVSKPEVPQATATPSKASRGNPLITTEAESAVSSGAPSDLTVTSPGGSTGSPHEKKVRALLKKLRAIEELKMRQAGGEKLELSQLSKIRTEDEVKKQLDDIGFKG